ncbi:polysaccharide biosynthesis tyrosine autokinase [Agriterribacter sp.]|uniref:GumC family protein n=1 Tax=Agriterribacter sp. TaxID=2821509 RepID=UPI002B94F027|nr:polysaccharide biosynthesis tyrosine autokinase [Agriterribacter sp.]HRO44583.1 polysaccharide biosynthesis tyrosine autokinase [Agriterribacter sp.]HRQ16020.1 polysaccharide biosynthesis tyrosine autokinase [Agriterribacter sp.]
MQDNYETGQPLREFNLKEFIFKYLRYWPLLAAFILIALTLAFIKVRYATPIYKVSGSLFINKEGDNRGSGESLENMFMFSGNLNLQNELEILKSKPLVSRVVKNLGLQVSYYNKGNVRSSNVYGASPIYLEILSLKDSAVSFTLEIEASDTGFRFPNTNTAIEYDKVFETKSGVFRVSRAPAVSFENYSSDNFLITYRPLPSASANLASAITTAQTIDQATILDLFIETDNIAYGKDVINALMVEYGKMNIEDKRRISQATMQFIDERLDTIKNELGDVESGILRFREKNEVVDLGQQSAQQFEILSESNKQLIGQQVQSGVLDYLLQYMQNPANRNSLVPASLGIQEPVLGPMFGQYNTLQLQRNNLLQTTGAANPAIATIDHSIEKLREQILEALKNVQQSYAIASNKLKEEITRSRTAVRKIPSKAMGLLDIERQQKIKQDLYLFLLQKREEAAISAAATVASSSPLEEATSTGSPVKPNQRNIYLIALFAGILIPVAIIALLEMLNDKIREREEIARQTRAPIIGEIGHAGEETLIVQAGSRTVVAEQFRIMRTNVQYMISKVNQPVILVTSSVSGEGKSFVATNYGAALALTGKKTVVLEFDIRKPRLLKGLNMQTTKGLSNYIIGNAGIEEIVQPVPEFPNLYVIGCGPVPPNPSELLLDKQVGKLFEELKTRFDYIIIDSAPVGLVSDAFTLSDYADASLYIIRHGYTLKRQLSMVEDLYQQKRLPNMGLVVNDIQTQGRYKGYYGYGGGTYYGYGYGYGYGGDYFQTETGKKSKFRKLFGKRG